MANFLTINIFRERNYIKGDVWNETINQKTYTSSNVYRNWHDSSIFYRSDSANRKYDVTNAHSSFFVRVNLRIRSEVRRVGKE